MAKQVLIIGGGIAGITLAIFLKREGIEASVYESYPYRKDAGAAFLLSPNALRVLEKLDIKERIQQNGWKVTSMEMRNKQGTLMMANYLVDEENQEHPMIYIARSDLMNSLLDKADLEGIKIHYGKKLDKIYQREDSVIALFKDGTEAVGTQLIGADGINSTTRQRIFPECTLKYAGYAIFQGLVSSEKIPHMNLNNMVAYSKGNLFIGISRCHPSERNNYHCFGTIFTERKIPTKEFEQKTTEALRKELLKVFEGWGDLVSSILTHTEKIYAKSRFEFAPLENWSRNRVTLIGDALHGTSPYTGQGVSVALEDAWYMATMLSQHDYKDAFYYFEYDRKPRIKELTDASTIELDFMNMFEKLKPPMKVEDVKLAQF
ncbi:FAD-dependent monooxygenase [Priestia endophytica]|uniref:FAD-dependent monooxygenase n=1 Tax=Priestia endophytica TaxID=135735 RepID=UPI001558CCD5|nr:FAD-dependent monooxygenase [Priestia endophytica]